MLVTIFFIAACAGIFVGLLWALYSAFRATREYKNPSDRYSRKTLFNPMNGLLMPGLLTERGLKHRKQVGRGIAVAAGCWFLAGIVTLVVQLAK